MIDFITHVSPYLFYPTLCLGLIFTGGAVLLPAMYLSILGTINLLGLFITVLVATLIADAVWYYAGMNIGKEKPYRWKFVQKRLAEAEKFSKFYEKHGLKMVFMAKFVFGTRIASQILAGMHKLNFITFQAAVLAGGAIWFWLLYFLLKSLHLGVAGVKSTASKIEIVLLIVVVLTVLINWFTKKYIGDRWTKEK
jgi:membrane protein DedA with SNARE-associated domain